MNCFRAMPSASATSSADAPPSAATSAHAAIVRSAIDLACNMGLGITAEGVEDDHAYRALCDLGCDQGQGMFFSRPLAADALTSWLRESRWPT